MTHSADKFAWKIRVFIATYRYHLPLHWSRMGLVAQVGTAVGFRWPQLVLFRLALPLRPCSKRNLRLNFESLWLFTMYIYIYTIHVHLIRKITLRFPPWPSATASSMDFIWMLSDWMIVLVDIGQPIELLGCSMFNYIICLNMFFNQNI